MSTWMELYGTSLRLPNLRLLRHRSAFFLPIFKMRLVVFRTVRERRAGVVFLASPNNPTGSLVNNADVERYSLL